MNKELNLRGPLVSIVIISYNSGKYILDTLESAKSQTYKNIELIISDDGSTDDTIKICNDWLKLNDTYFVNSKLLISDRNTGIPANCNRGLKVSKGEWIKLIAGDDILRNDCIKSNIIEISKNSKIEIIFSNCELFHSIGNEIKILGTQPKEEQKKWFGWEAKMQYLLLLQFNFNWTTPTIFVKLSLLREVGLFDERFPYFEDYPLWLRITQKGIRLHYFDENTVLYRQAESVTRVQNEWMNYNYYKSRLSFFKSEVMPILFKHDKKKMVLKLLFVLKMEILFNIFKNKKILPARIFNKIYQIIFNPISI